MWHHDASSSGVRETRSDSWCAGDDAAAVTRQVSAPFARAAASAATVASVVPLWEIGDADASGARRECRVEGLSDLDRRCVGAPECLRKERRGGDAPRVRSSRSQ